MPRSHRKAHIWLWPGLCSLLLAGSCHAVKPQQVRDDVDVPVKPQQVRDDADVEARVSAALSDLMDGETEAFLDLFDMNRLGDRVLEDLDLKRSARLQVRIGLASQESELASSLSASLRNAESVTHLRTRSEGDYIISLYRVRFPEGALNYFECRIDADSLRIVDWYDHAQGLELSENMRALILPLLDAQALTSLVARLSTGKNASVKHLRSVMKAIQDEDFAKAVDLFRVAPESVQSGEAALNLLISAAPRSEKGSDYEYALEQVARHGGGRPRFAFMLIDYHLLRGEFDQSLAALKTVQDRLGLVESGLEELKAGIYIVQGDRLGAIRQLKRAIELEPNRGDPYAALFELYIITEQYAAAHETLTVLNERFDYNLQLEDFAEDPEWADYVQWVRAHLAP